MVRPTDTADYDPDTVDGVVPFGVGDLAQYRGDEEMRGSKPSTVGLTMLAFLAPVCPPTSVPGTT